ncbi:MAG: hypothetical protein D3925_15670, partial [Candidatus Electrothrix sp. AR5]|nr:hypothetical protein [Candidatus Electrothrix sp. AR5]
MNSPNPKTLRGKIVWFVLKNLPGLFFILILLGAALLIGQRVGEQKAAREEELKNSTAVEAPPTNVVALELNPTVLRDKITLQRFLTGDIKPQNHFPSVFLCTGSFRNPSRACRKAMIGLVR